MTGGSRGIGKAIALRFAELGAARVAIGYLRNDRAAEATAEELRAAGAEPLLVRGNVASERVAAEVAELGPFDVLVHNAATGVIRPALETEDKHWDWTLVGERARAARRSRGRARRRCRRARRSSASRASARSACSTTTRSSASRRPRSRRSSATSRSSSRRAGSASTPSPAGVVETGALEHFPNREEMISAGLKRTPAGRLVEPGDVADAVCFLCSPEAEMVCGHTLIVDGGFSLLA